MKLQIQSIRSPFDEPQLASAAIRALTSADAMGLLAEPVTCLDDSAIETLATGLAEAGIGQALGPELQFRPSDPERLSAVLERINEALYHSPAPAREWRVLREVLGLDCLTRQLSISQPSVRRYLSGSRRTPDLIAARLHFLALLVGDLAGSYNEIGIRRWFERRREPLGGRTPAEVLDGAWSPEDDGPRQVRNLARALAFFPAT